MMCTMPSGVMRTKAFGNAPAAVDLREHPARRPRPSRRDDQTPPPRPAERNERRPMSVDMIVLPYCVCGDSPPPLRVLVAAAVDAW